MPRFYLHIKDGTDFIRDEEGIDVPSAAYARAEALVSARELWADAIRAGGDVGADAYVIAGESGQQLTFVPFAEALPKRLRR
jgi:uncharacterized protein DUF6894